MVQAIIFVVIGLIPAILSKSMNSENQHTRTHTNAAKRKMAGC